MGISTEETIKKLRCTATPGGGEDDVCRECRYAIKEELGGEPYISCDTDRVVLDAAERLEELSHGQLH